MYRGVGATQRHRAIIVFVVEFIILSSSATLCISSNRFELFSMKTHLNPIPRYNENDETIDASLFHATLNVITGWRHFPTVPRRRILQLPLKSCLSSTTMSSQSIPFDIMREWCPRRNQHQDQNRDHVPAQDQGQDQVQLVATRDRDHVPTQMANHSRTMIII